MMSSEISTDRRTAEPVAPDDAGFQPWHFFVFLAMIAAIVGVVLSRHTEPAALILLSVALLGVGVVGIAAHRALAALLAKSSVLPSVRGERLVESLAREKRHVLHAIKETEFDHRMGKINEKDFRALAAPLRARAMALMQDLDRAGGGYRARIQHDLEARVGPAPKVKRTFCSQCGTLAEVDAKFCKECGRNLQTVTGHA